MHGNGGLAGTRTPDQCLKRALLYQLSYQPKPLRQNELQRFIRNSNVDLSPILVTLRVLCYVST